MNVPSGHPRNHPTGAESLHQKNVRHYREDVVVRGEWREPVQGKVADPNDQDHEVDGKDPKQ